MTEQNNAQLLIEQIKRQEWTPEVFEQTQQMILHGVRMFAILRQELSPEQYDKFDLEYCSHFRPQERQLTEWLKEKRKQKEWKEKRVEALKKKKQLLKQRKQLLTQS